MELISEVNVRHGITAGKYDRCQVDLANCDREPIHIPGTFLEGPPDAGILLLRGSRKLIVDAVLHLRNKLKLAGVF
jgi:light-regulated signal transduction histidine kinase (bacteriophytochrome)